MTRMTEKEESMQEALLPCPFCGQKPSVWMKTLGEMCAYANEITISCIPCGVRMKQMGDTSKPGYADNSQTQNKIITRWNRRA